MFAFRDFASTTMLSEPVAWGASSKWSVPLLPRIGGSDDMPIGYVPVYEAGRGTSSVGKLLDRRRYYHVFAATEDGRAQGVISKAPSKASNTLFQLVPFPGKTSDGSRWEIWLVNETKGTERLVSDSYTGDPDLKMPKYEVKGDNDLYRMRVVEHGSQTIFGVSPTFPAVAGKSFIITVSREPSPTGLTGAKRWFVFPDDPQNIDGYKEAPPLP
jgi:hypothetical protein